MKQPGKHNSSINKAFFEKVWFYLRFSWNFVVLRRPVPLFYGIVITERCNLNCLGCHVANTGTPSMGWSRLVKMMQNAWQRGFRELYFTGGEPMLWYDGEHTLKDAIIEAKRIGFFHVHVYTNGTLGLDTPADMVWVSMDGLPGTFEKRRGDHFAQVERAVRNGRHPKAAVIYVIDRNTASGIEPFLHWVCDTKFPIIGVMFYFHTPYYGYDELYLDAVERAPIIDQLLGYLRAGLPVLNSSAGLRALKSGRWARRIPSVCIADSYGESTCCRASDDVCRDCGYSACVEIAAYQHLRPSSIAGLLRYW